MNNSFKEYMNVELIKRGYFNFEEVKKEDIVEVMEDYFYNQLGKESGSDIFGLFNEYRLQKSEDNIEEIISYLLSCISIVQEGEIEWWQFDHNKEPQFYYDEETNKIIYLNTSIEIDYQKVFTLLLNTLIDLKVSREEEMIK